MSYRIRSRTVAVAGVVLAVVSACASTPVPNENLEQARSGVQQLRTAPDASQLAGVQIDDAQMAFEKAEKAWRSASDKPVVDHLSSIADRKTQIAQNVLDRRRAEQRIEQAGNDRNELLLANRDLQAKQKEEQIARMQRENSQLRTTVTESKQAMAELNNKMRALSAKETNRGMVVTLAGVLFSTGQSTLKAGADRKLDRVAEVLRENPERRVLIEGFTDSTGGESANQQLSQARADAVMDQLLRKGIERNRIRARGLGETFPVASNSAPAGRQQNRRVELVISNDGNDVTDRDNMSRSN